MVYFLKKWEGVLLPGHVFRAVPIGNGSRCRGDFFGFNLSLCVNKKTFMKRDDGEADAESRMSPAGTGRRDGAPLMTKSRFAFTGQRRTPADDRSRAGGDHDIEFIPDGDISKEDNSKESTRPKKSSDISYAERRGERGS